MQRVNLPSTRDITNQKWNISCAYCNAISLVLCLIWRNHYVTVLMFNVTQQFSCYTKNQPHGGFSKKYRVIALYCAIKNVMTYFPTFTNVFYYYLYAKIPGHLFNKSLYILSFINLIHLQSMFHFYIP